MLPAAVTPKRIVWKKSKNSAEVQPPACVRINTAKAAFNTRKPQECFISMLQTWPGIFTFHGADHAFRSA